ncbi:uncharacterized protein LOC110466557 isoform X2 [Mizuhopecten yessoensis]|nr:uncharacterized protein LOC110466557 isoform X2 [Mizuhopecten yessoensis]
MLLILLMTGYELPSKQWLPSITAQYEGKCKTNASSLVALPVTTETPRLKGYIVYDCDDHHSGPCGGWSDRMSGMFSAYVISVLLHKHFLVRCTRSFNLTDYFIPNSIDWKYNSSLLVDMSSKYHNFFCKTPNAIKEKNLTSLKHLFTKDVDFVRINWDYIKHFREFQGIKKVIPWVSDLPFADIYLKFFNTLFKPTKIITEAVNKIVKNVTKLACAHIRMGKSDTIIWDSTHTEEKQLKHVWIFLKTMEETNHSIFIATDAQFVRNTAKALFKHLLETKGRILHIDQRAGGDGLFGGYTKVFVDFFVLTKCDVLLLTKSGFGMMSAYLSIKSSDLYCLTPYEVVPCSRYTLQRFYPTQILSPV